MIKFLTFLLIVYLLIKFSRFLIRFVINMVVTPSNERVNHNRKRPTDGNVDIDFIPNDYNKSKTSYHSNHKSGDYVEYEEIKEK